MLIISDIEDIWNHINDLKKEGMEMSNGQVKETVKSVFYQLPFFCCPDNFIEPKFQKDIEKYLYCEDTKTPAFPGHYGSIPNIWIEKHFIIKQSLSILNKMKMEQFKRK